MDELFPVTTVGSWPRSARLRRALRQRQAGEISGEEFDAVADEAVLDALQHQEAAGVDIVTDGEQRRDNFYSFVVGKIDGMRLMPVSELLDYLPDRARFEETLRALDVPAFAIKSPVAVDKLRLRSGLAQDEVAFLQRHTQRPIKVPLPGPYLLTRSAWIEQLSGDAYATQEDLAADVVSILRQELLALRDMGVRSSSSTSPPSPRWSTARRARRRSCAPRWPPAAIRPTSWSSLSTWSTRPSAVSTAAASACTSAVATGAGARRCCWRGTTGRSCRTWCGWTSISSCSRWRRHGRARSMSSRSTATRGRSASA